MYKKKPHIIRYHLSIYLSIYYILLVHPSISQSVNQSVVLECVSISSVPPPLCPPSLSVALSAATRASRACRCRIAAKVTRKHYTIHSVMYTYIYYIYILYVVYMCRKRWVDKFFIIIIIIIGIINIHPSIHPSIYRDDDDAVGSIDTSFVVAAFLSHIHHTRLYIYI